MAMDSRCYDGKLDLMEQTCRAKPKTILAAAVYLVVATTIAVLTRGVPLL